LFMLWVVFVCAFGLSKHLKKRRFLEDGYAENLQDCVETGVDVEALLDDGDQDIDGDGDPDLGLDGVLGGSEEALDAQVLLDPFEEQLDLPAAFVEPCNGQCRQGEVVGQEDEDLAGFGIAICDAAELFGVALGRTDAGWDDDMVAAQAGGLIDGVGIEPCELEVGASPDDEEGGGLGQTVEAGEVDIAAVHDVEGAGLGDEFVEHPGIVPGRDRYSRGP
jgi:hypothetical protein